MTLDDLSGHTSCYEKNLFLHYVDILEKILKGWALSKIYRRNR